MTSFMNADFLLKSETAKTLYHNYAEKMPIIDYHCHINPMEIYEGSNRSTLSVHRRSYYWLFYHHSQSFVKHSRENPGFFPYTSISGKIYKNF